jgi:hypothetical protein
MNISFINPCIINSSVDVYALGVSVRNILDVLDTYTLQVPDHIMDTMNWCLEKLPACRPKIDDFSFCNYCIYGSSCRIPKCEHSHFQSSVCPPTPLLPIRIPRLVRTSVYCERTRDRAAPLANPVEWSGFDSEWNAPLADIVEWSEDERKLNSPLADIVVWSGDDSEWNAPLGNPVEWSGDDSEWNAPLADIVWQRSGTPTVEWLRN